MLGIPVCSRRRFSDKSGNTSRVSFSFLVRRALSPKLMTWYLPPVQNSGKDAGTSFAFGLHAPRFFKEISFVVDLISYLTVYASVRQLCYSFNFKTVKRTMNPTPTSLGVSR
ncbi:hypothetical protein Tco_0883181 [Tanacetum coccineum]